MGVTRLMMIEIEIGIGAMVRPALSEPPVVLRTPRFAAPKALVFLECGRAFLPSSQATLVPAATELAQLSLGH